MREKQATDLQGRQFAHKAKKAAMDERLQKSRDLFAATAILAGGSQNINAGNRGIYQQAAGIEDKAKQAEFLAQFRQRPGGFQSNDPRIQVAQIEAQSRKETAEADREGRASEKQWLIAAEERATARRAEEAKTEREFRAEERRLDAAAADKRGDSAALVEINKLKLELENRKLEFEAKSKADELRHQETKALMGGQTDAAKYTADARVREAEVTAGVAAGAQATAKEDLKREQSLAPLAAQYGEGVRHIAAGDYATPQAQDALRKLAKQSDESWFGFGKKDAVRMEAILQRLGVVDQDARREMIERFGYEPSNNFLGMGGDGRGERLSYWFSGRPW
jgi:hypothetical protein